MLNKCRSPTFLRLAGGSGISSCAADCAVEDEEADVCSERLVLLIFDGGAGVFGVSEVLKSNSSASGAMAALLNSDGILSGSSGFLAGSSE